MPAVPVYLDHNATTPIDPAVAKAMLPYLHGAFGNPSSTHVFGSEAKQAVEKARGQVARLLGAEPDEILFTSGGSESNNTAIRGAAWGQRARGRHLITSAVEHPAVLEPCRALQAEGFELSILPVDDGGALEPETVRGALRPDTTFITVMHANNEVGTMQPIRQVSEVARGQDILLHTDAAQSCGKVPVNVDDLGVDLLSIAGHKLYAPKGVGALYIRRGRSLPRLIHGAGHESGRRAGTENVLGIVGLGEACELAAGRLEEGERHSRELRDRLWESLSTAGVDVLRNGVALDSLPNTLSVSFPGVDAGRLLEDLDGEVAASPGAACHAEGVEVSTVLAAMGIPMEQALGTVRFSVGRTTTMDEVDRAAQAVLDAVRRLRSA